MWEDLSKVDKSAGDPFKKFSEFVGHESSGEVNSIFPQAPTVPRVSMPYVSMHQKTAKSIKEWLENYLCSSKNIAKLAESSLGVLDKGDEDLRMREMIPEEVASLKRYGDVTEDVMTVKRYLNVSYETFTSFSCIFCFLKTNFLGGSSFYFIIKTIFARFL